VWREKRAGQAWLMSECQQGHRLGQRHAVLLHPSRAGAGTNPRARWGGQAWGIQKVQSGLVGSGVKAKSR